MYRPLPGCSLLPAWSFPRKGLSFCWRPEVCTPRAWPVPALWEPGTPSPHGLSGHPSGTTQGRNTQEQSQGEGTARGAEPAGQSVRRSAGEDSRPPPGSAPPPNDCAHRPGKRRRGCATRRRARSFGALLEAPRRRRGRGPIFSPPAPVQPPVARFWRGTPPPAPPGRSGNPHLANSTVPCSSGLRLTARQLCRISSGSGRSMLARGRGALGWDPRGAGTVTARAAPSPRRRGPLRTPYGPPRLSRAGCSRRSFPALGGGAPPCPPGWRFRGPRSGRCALRAPRLRERPAPRRPAGAL